MAQFTELSRTPHFSLLPIRVTRDRGLGLFLSGSKIADFCCNKGFRLDLKGM